MRLGVNPLDENRNGFFFPFVFRSLSNATSPSQETKYYTLDNKPAVERQKGRWSKTRIYRWMFLFSLSVIDIYKIESKDCSRLAAVSIYTPTGVCV